MVLKHQLSGSVRRKSLAKLRKTKELEIRLELLGPMLFYIRYQDLVPNRFIKFLQERIVSGNTYGFLISCALFGLFVLGFTGWIFLPPIYLTYIWIIIWGLIVCYFTLLILNLLTSAFLTSLEKKIENRKREYTHFALTLISQCKEIVKLQKDLLTPSDTRLGVDEMNKILHQIRAHLKQIGDTWKSYVEISNLPPIVQRFYTLESDIHEEEYHIEVFKWISDMMGVIELNIQTQLWIIAADVNQQKFYLVEVQNTGTELAADGLLELQKQRLAALEESIAKITPRDILLQ